MNTVTDPVCGMTIDPAEAVGSSTYDGETYSFCARGCQKKFDEAPALYVGSTTNAAAAACGCATATANACH